MCPISTCGTSTATSDFDLLAKVFHLRIERLLQLFMIPTYLIALCSRKAVCVPHQPEYFVKDRLKTFNVILLQQCQTPALEENDAWRSQRQSIIICFVDSSRLYCRFNPDHEDLRRSSLHLTHLR